MSTTTRKFKTVITDTGAKKLAQAAAPDGKPVRLTHMAVGDGGGTLPTPDSKQTRLVHEVWRHTVNRVILDATHQNRIIAELVIPPETGGFWIREIGVFDEHGDLIAVGNTAESYKPAVAEGSGRAQTFRTILTVSSTATVALTVDNTMVMATVDYVDDKLKEHEQSRRHPDASLTAKGFVQLSSATNSVSETQAATPKAVKAAYDLANGKYTAQDATTARKGLVQLSSATNSTSETQAATPKAVKAAYDLANAKYTAQDATTAQKGIVQLSSATNSTSETLAATSKAVKAVMDETNKKAPLNSPALTGTPTTPTARQGTNNTQIASTAFVMAAIAALVDSSPDALNTLNELAAALGNDPNFATTMTNALAGKQPKDATLTALAELATSADKLPYFTGADRAALTALTSVGRAILGKTSTQGVLDYLGLGEGSALPVGVPVPWPLETPPTGWLKCNGAAFSSEKYPKLAKAYPTNKLPDLRGEFIRGWDDGRGVDAGRTILSAQGDAIRNIYGEFKTVNTENYSIWESVGSFKGAVVPLSPSTNNSYFSLIRSMVTERTDGTVYPKVIGLDASRIVPTANENRPRNIAFNYIVRAA